MKVLSKEEMILYDLVMIQQERMSACCYLRKWLSDHVLTDLVEKLEEQAKQFQMELRSCLHTGRPDPAGQSEQKGELYQQWEGIHKIKPGCSEYDLIVSCEENERSTTLLYENILKEERELTRDICRIISTQLEKMGKSLAVVIETKLYASAINQKSRELCIRP
jgi:hypothetical protein